MNPPPESEHPEPPATGDAAPPVPVESESSLSEDGLYPPAELAYPAPAGEAYDPATAGFEYAGPAAGEPPAVPEYGYTAPYEEEPATLSAPEYAYAAPYEEEPTLSAPEYGYAAPYEGELTAAAPPEYEDATSYEGDAAPAAADYDYLAPVEGELPPSPGYEYAAPAAEMLAQVPPPEYAYLAPVGDGHVLPPVPEPTALSAAEPFPVLEPATADLPEAADPAPFEVGYALLPPEHVAAPLHEPTPDELQYAPRPATAAPVAHPAPPVSLRSPPPNVPDDQVALLCEGLERFLGAAEARVHVLRGVSLRLEPGFVHAVVGPSGCGKSSLLYILGLLDRPDAGRLVISGRPVANLADDELSRQRSALLGFIFQFHFLLQDFSAQENIMIPMRQLGVLSEPQMRERSAYLLDAVGLGDKGHRASRHLSGGEQQRVAIARALANDPQVILADEPTGNLDTANSTRVFSLLTDLVHRENKALLLVTHNPAIAEACDWVHTMRDGLIVDQQFVGMQS